MSVRCCSVSFIDLQWQAILLPRGTNPFSLSPPSSAMASGAYFTVQTPIAGNHGQKWKFQKLASKSSDFSGFPLLSGKLSSQCNGNVVLTKKLAFQGAETYSRPLTKISCQAASSSEKLTVAITGATGFIGKRLVEKLLEGGHSVKVLTRSSESARNVFNDKLSKIEIAEPSGWASAIQGSTAVVNLAGTPISTRWTPEIKEEIKKSRVDVTNKVVSAINDDNSNVKVLLSSSAIGFYGTSETISFDENSPSGKDYLAEVCREWEAAANNASGVRTVLVRTGIVLEKDGGALAKMVPLFYLFAGGPLGSGKQWFSWIHREDLVDLIVESLTNDSYSGVINGTAPNPVRFVEMCDQLGRVIGRPSWLPVPEFAVKALLGDGASVVLDGQKVLPKRTQELGFTFKYRYIYDALKAILN